MLFPQVIRGHLQTFICKGLPKTNSILILATIGVFSVIAVFVAIYLLSDNGSDNPANSDPLSL